MNSRQYSLLFVVAFLGFASAQIDVPHATANMSSNSDQVTQGQTYQASCDYTVHKPTNSDGQQSEWELTVAFHKETMGMHDNWPVIAEYKQNGTDQMVFRTRKLIDGLNVWPEGGVVQQARSPMNVVVIPGGDFMYTNGQWKCSVTMQQKGTDVKLRFMSKGYMATSKPSN